LKLNVKLRITCLHTTQRSSHLVRLHSNKCTFSVAFRRLGDSVSLFIESDYFGNDKIALSEREWLGLEDALVDDTVGEVDSVAGLAIAHVVLMPGLVRSLNLNPVRGYINIAGPVPLDADIILLGLGSRS